MNKDNEEEGPKNIRRQLSNFILADRFKLMKFLRVKAAQGINPESGLHFEFSGTPPQTYVLKRDGITVFEVRATLK